MALDYEGRVTKRVSGFGSGDLTLWNDGSGQVGIDECHLAHVGPCEIGLGQNALKKSSQSEGGINKACLRQRRAYEIRGKTRSLKIRFGENALTEFSPIQIRLLKARLPTHTVRERRVFEVRPREVGLVELSADNRDAPSLKTTQIGPIGNKQEDLGIVPLRPPQATIGNV